MNKITAKGIIFSLIILIAAGLSAFDVPKLKIRKPVDGIKVKLPKDFIPMSDNDIAKKYPSTKKPVFLYTDQDRVVDYGINVSKTVWPGDDLNILRDFYRSNLYNLYNSVELISDTVKEVNNRTYITFEFTSVADQTQSYTYIMYTLIKGKVFILNFTAPAQEMDEWQPVAHAVSETVKIKENKLSDEYFKAIGKHQNRKGASPDQVLDMQKRNTSENK